MFCNKKGKTNKMVKKREKILNSIIGITVSVVAVISFYISFCIYYKKTVSIFEYPSFKLFSTVIFIELILLNLFTGINRSILKRSIYRESLKAVQETIYILSGLILILFWFHMIDETKRLIFLYFAIIFCLLDYLTRVTIKRFVFKVFNQSKFSQRVLVVTEKQNSRNIIKELDNNFDWTRQIVGICLEDDDGQKQVRKKKVVCTFDTLLTYVTKNSIDELFIFVSDEDLDKIKDSLSKIEESGVKVNISINFEMFDYLPNSFVRYDKIGPYQCICVSRNNISYRSRVSKFLLDYLGGVVGFCIFSIAYIILAPLIKLDSKGPVLFRQQRVGRNGRIFNCYKFRSMVADAEEKKKCLMSKNEMNGLMFKMENDPRITKLGRFIRKTSLDELPQFINVLKGDMSLVGTRPPTVDEFKNYEPKHKARVSMVPGLTGLWQVSGRSNIKNFDDVVKLDMEYIDNWSIMLDIKIIFKTVFIVLFGKGAK